MRIPPLTRRELLRNTAAASAVVAAPWIIPASARGADAVVPPSNRINVALIGRGAMGSGHLRRLAGDPGVQLLAVCDVDASRRDEGKRRVEEMYAAEKANGTYRGCAAYNDYRDALARPDIDAVLIATPDHWHTLQSIDAARAGKDVYCEKPISLNVQQGREVVRAVRRHGRVFQTGTQYRSIPTIRRVCQFIRNGGLGRIKSVFTNWQNLGAFMGGRLQAYSQAMGAHQAAASFVPLSLPLPADPVPQGLDWDMWVGPAVWHEYNRLYHVNPSPGVVPWSFCEDFGVASSTWFHSHAADVIQYALGMEESCPVEFIHPTGGQYPTLTCKYANGTLLHYVEHWGQVKSLYNAVPANARLEGLFGGLFVGERGWLTSMTGSGPIEGGPPDVLRELGLDSREVNHGSNDHHANWFECIRTRLRPSCHEEIGHRSAALGHLTIIAYKLGRSLKWDPVREEFIGDDQANRLRGRALREPWCL